LDIGIENQRKRRNPWKRLPGKSGLFQSLRSVIRMLLQKRNNSVTANRKSNEVYKADKGITKNQLLIIVLLYLIAIAIAELVTALVSPIGGIIIHIFLLIGLVLHASIVSRQVQRRFYLSLALAPLIRILSLSMPLTKLPQIYWYAIIAVPLLIAVFAVIRILNFRRREIGFTLHRLRLQLLIGLTGIPFGIVEYYILKPDPLVESLTWQTTVLPAFILLVGTGLVEEVTFRGVIQTSAEETLGRWGWIYVAGLFAIMHTGYLLLADIAFVLAVGLFFGWVVKETRSLLGVTLSHGVANIVLYLIVPFII
jgi:membrane protease YdiL (CAAX protease family)